jgi:hypothetical protein
MKLILQYLNFVIFSFIVQNNSHYVARVVHKIFITEYSVIALAACSVYASVLLFRLAYV